MEYTNRFVRRQDRLLDKERAFELLSVGEYGYLSLTKGGEAYGLPINYVFEKDCLYFHCAPEGLKMELIKKTPKASFCVVGKTNVLSSKFTTEYESIILSGTIEVITKEEERTKALMLILQKYSPNDLQVGMRYIEKSRYRTTILRFSISTMSGKCKII